VEGATAELALRNFIHKEENGFVSSQHRQSAYGRKAWQSTSTIIKAQSMYFHMKGELDVVLDDWHGGLRI
jgi:hypothetical protein